MSPLNLGSQNDSGNSREEPRPQPSTTDAPSTTPPPPVSNPEDVASRGSGQPAQEAHGAPKKAFVEGHVLLPNSSKDLSCENGFSSPPVVTVMAKGIMDTSWAPATLYNPMPVDSCGIFKHQFSYLWENGACSILYKYHAEFTDKSGNAFSADSCIVECPVTGSSNPLKVILQPTGATESPSSTTCSMGN